MCEAAVHAKKYIKIYGCGKNSIKVLIFFDNTFRNTLNRFLHDSKSVFLPFDEPLIPLLHEI